MASATTAVQQGVNAVQTSPTALAAANVNGYLAGVQQAVSSGKWANNLNRVSLADWKNSMLNKGVQRMQTGAAAAVPKVTSAFGPLLQYIYDTRDQINAANPRGSLQMNIQRSVAMQTAMANYNAT
jgi:hypothetical protein